MSVNNVTDTIAPLVLQQSYNNATFGNPGGGIFLSMNEVMTIAAGKTPTPAMFELKVNGSVRAISSVFMDAAARYVRIVPDTSTQGMPQPTDVMTIRYIPPAVDNTGANAALQDAAGNDAAAFGPLSVDSIRPTYVSAQTNYTGSSIRATFSEDLINTFTDLSRFTLKEGGVVRTISSMAFINARTVEFIPANAIQAGTVVTLDYAQPTTTPTDDASIFNNNAMQDVSGNDMAAFTGKPVTNLVDLTAPVLQSARTTKDGLKVILAYNETLSSATAAATAFAVTLNGQANPVTAVVISGSTVELTLTNAVTTGDLVTAAYTDPTSGDDANAVQDPAGNDAATFAATPVTNLVDNTPPTFVSAATNLSGSKVILTYSEALDAVTAGTNAFTLKVGGNTVTVNSATVNGSTVELTLAVPVAQG